jgi:hypothetical protein
MHVDGIRHGIELGFPNETELADVALVERGLAARPASAFLIIGVAGPLETVRRTGSGAAAVWTRSPLMAANIASTSAFAGRGWPCGGISPSRSAAITWFQSRRWLANESGELASCCKLMLS